MISAQYKAALAEFIILCGTDDEDEAEIVSDAEITAIAVKHGLTEQETAMLFEDANGPIGY